MKPATSARAAAMRLRFAWWWTRGVRPARKTRRTARQVRVGPLVGRHTAVYCAYTPDDRLRAYHQSALHELRAAGLNVILVVNGTGADPVDVPDDAHWVLARPNAGYDFGAWREGVAALRAAGHSADRLLLMNDSAYGPLPGYGSWLGSVAVPTHGCWGPVHASGPFPHLQSWLLVFDGAAVDAVAEWLRAVTDLRHKESVIARYEIGLSRAMRRANIPLAASIQARSNVIGRLRNPAHDHWRELLEAGVPFIKRELLFDDPFGVMSCGDLPNHLASHPEALQLILADLEAGRR